MPANLLNRTYGRPSTYAITGNIFNRSGAKTPADAAENCHILLDYVAGVTISGNAMITGVDDSGDGLLWPAYGIVCNGLADSVIKDNSWYQGVTREFLLDGGRP